MRRFFKGRTAFVSAIIIIFLLTRFSFFAPVRDVIRVTISRPAALFVEIGSKFHNSFGVLFSVKNLAKENVDLRQQLTAAEARVAELSQAKGENEALKKELDFEKSHPALDLLSASVINYSPSSLYQAVTINRGSKDGVEIGQAVESSGFLIGKIHAISDHTAEIWLLSNRNLLTPVLLTDSQTVGLLKGSIRGLVVENIPLDTKVGKGSPIVTSSLEGQYPAGIAIGSVEEIISTKEEIFQTLRIITPINPSNLTTVYIVK